MEGQIKKVSGEKFHSDKMRVKDAAKYFGLSVAWFQQAIIARKIPHYKLGKAVFISAREIEAMIEDGRVEAK